MKIVKEVMYESCNGYCPSEVTIDLNVGLLDRISKIQEFIKENRLKEVRIDAVGYVDWEDDDFDADIIVFIIYKESFTAYACSKWDMSQQIESEIVYKSEIEECYKLERE